MKGCRAILTMTAAIQISVATMNVLQLVRNVKDLSELVSATIIIKHFVNVLKETAEIRVMERVVSTPNARIMPEFHFVRAQTTWLEIPSKNVVAKVHVNQTRVVHMVSANML